MTDKTDKKDCIRAAWRLVTTAMWPFIAEHRFAKPRQWRFDWADPGLKLAIEIDGGMWMGTKGKPGKPGRHGRPVGFENDCEKHNAALDLGWRVLRFTPSMVNRDPVGCVELIIRVADRCSWRREVI